MVQNEHVFHIDPQSPIPLYYQIRENLRDLITNGKFSVGDAIPSERELVQIYQVNRLTVRQAITELVNEGLLSRQQGVGTFVAKPKITQTMPELSGFTDRIRSAGHTPSSRLLAAEIVPAPDRAARALQLAPSDSIVKLVRLRLADGEPFMVETACLPNRLFPDLLSHDFETQSLYHVLSTVYEIHPVEADEIIEPVALAAYEAEILETTPNTPALQIEGTIYTQGRQPIEFTRSIVRGDKARYHFRIHRSGKSTTTRITP